jgi:hypothetical protein
MSGVVCVEELRRALCASGVVGQIDGHDVIRREFTPPNGTKKIEIVQRKAK